MSSRQERRRAERVMSQFTENEVLVLLAAAVEGIAHFGDPEDAGDRESLLELRSAVQKLRRMVGMPDDVLHAFAAHAAGKPPEGIVKAFAEEDARRRAGQAGPHSAPLGAADPAKVRAIMEWLVARFEEYVSEHETAYLDAFMGAHNFHKAIVRDLIERTEKEPLGRRMLLMMARDTWVDAMNAEMKKRAN